MTRQTLSNRGIGASEISTIVGCNPYETPWGLYLRKTGQAPDIDPTPQIEWGHRLEPAIRQKYADDTGAVMYVPAESMFSEVFPWARATPDAIVLAESFDGRDLLPPRDAWRHLMQVKNVGYWPGKDWEQGPPLYVQLQEMWEMFVAKLPRADVAALIAGSDYRMYTVHRDEALVADIVDIAAAFWRRVETRTPPVVDDSEACRRHFAARLARVQPVELVADADAEALMATWRQARHERERAKSEVERLRNSVLSLLDGAKADRLVSSIGTAKLARTGEREHKETDWALVAQLIASAPQPVDRETYEQIVAANTTTTVTAASAALKEPREWSKEQR